MNQVDYPHPGDGRLVGVAHPPPARHVERAVVVYRDHGGQVLDDALEEARMLAEAAGALVVGMVVARAGRLDSGTYFSTGKVREIAGLVAADGIDVVIVNHAISPIQERNLERELQCKVLDRTRLILDIFAQRATSREGQLQVELAQLTHLSTRLVRGWTHLERQKGGIGLRGPGETQLETDRRLIGNRIKSLDRRLARVRAQRDLHRRSRRRVPVPTVSLVGYTNAGKSSLFNQLAAADVYAADQLFATLDPVMRRIDLPECGAVILSDTVGFIRDLPHSLVSAFHATLEEVTEASLLLHVVDACAADHRDLMDQVDAVLEEIDAGSRPRITVFNKIDRAGQMPRAETDSDGRITKVWLSAASGAGIELLEQAMASYFNEQRPVYRIRVPAGDGRARAALFRLGSIVQERVTDDGLQVVDTRLDHKSLGQLRSRYALHGEPLDRESK